MRGHTAFQKDNKETQRNTQKMGEGRKRDRREKTKTRRQTEKGDKRRQKDGHPQGKRLSDSILGSLSL